MDVDRRDLTEAEASRLRLIFDRGAENAEHALSTWLGQTVRLHTSDVDLAPMETAAQALGPEDATIAACIMGVSGPLSGVILLAFDDENGLALVDRLMRQPVGTSRSWGDLERSAALETANIVGCAYLNALAMHLPGAGNGSERTLVPTPPEFRHEFAGSLLEFVLMDQAQASDRWLLARTQFVAEGQALNWSLLLVPSAEAIDRLMRILHDWQTPPTR